MPKLSLFVAVFGVFAILLFTFHWIFKVMHWPGASYLKLGAFVIGGLGLVLMVLDYFIQRSTREPSKQEDWDGEEHDKPN